jgi:predicted AlkP superfamily phosphohydrolase/phosphomutase
MSTGPPTPHRLVVAIGLLVTLTSCESSRRQPLTIWFCIDGATFEIIDDLRSEGKLPVLDRLIRSGTSGPMTSLAARRLMRSNRQRGYWSPILWASMATGVVPEKHGVQDFLLPVAGTSQVWMGSEDEPPRAELRFPEVSTSDPVLLRARLRSHTPNGEQSIGVRLNGEPLAEWTVGVEWQDYTAPIAPDQLRPARNHLVFELSRQSRPSDNSASSDHRLLAAELSGFELVDRRGKRLYGFDPVYGRFSLGRGFYQPEAKVVEAQSGHMKVAPVWSLLGDRGHPVAIVGYWTTWPAYPVNGYLVSSRMGLRGRRQHTESQLTWPPELAGDIEPLYPAGDAMKSIFANVHLSDCEPPLMDDEGSVVPDVLRQDELYFRAAKKLLPNMDHGLFAVYFESIDVASHAYLHWRQGAALREGCPDSVRDVVDEVYVQVDRWLGELVSLLPEGARILVVSDHGLVASSSGGLHSPEGIFIASGEGIRRRAQIGGVGILDVAPTLLYLFGEPIPFGMDGKVIAQAFTQGWLESHPQRYRDEDIAFRFSGETSAEGDEEALERLRSIGYIN